MRMHSGEKETNENWLGQNAIRYHTLWNIYHLAVFICEIIPKLIRNTWI